MVFPVEIIVRAERYDAPVGQQFVNAAFHYLFDVESVRIWKGLYHDHLHFALHLSEIEGYPTNSAVTLHHLRRAWN